MKNNWLRVALLLVMCLIFAVCLPACKKEPATYSVTFAFNNGAASEVLSVKDGETPSLPEEPTRYGFLFAGWFRDAELKEAASPASEPVSGDVTYYAAWTPAESVQIRFDTKGGTAVAPVAILKGNVLAESEIGSPTKEGYTFSGWYRNSACTAKYNFGTVSTENMTLYAGWKLNDGMCELIGMVDGTEVARVASAADAPALLPTSQNGVSYLWYRDSLLTEPFDGTVTGGSVTLYGLAYTEGLVIENGTVTGYRGAERNVTVPSRWNGVAVTRIGAHAFAGNRDVKKIALPATVTEIGESAFYDCYSLSQINLTGACKTLGAYAFYHCEKLSTVGDLSGLDEIAEHTFLGCKRLTSVDFSDSLIAVGKYAFANCESLQAVLLPDTVTVIEEYAFAGCREIRQFRIPAALNDFRIGALKDCKALTELIPSAANDTALFRVTDGNLYGAYGKTLVLYVCGDKTETTFALPEGCTEIAPFAFSGNVNLTRLSLDNEAVTVRCGALSGMEALQELTVYTLPEGNAYLAYFFGAESGKANGSAGNYSPVSLEKVTLINAGSELADYAFYGFTGLREIVGIESVRSVGAFAFAYTALTDIEIPVVLNRIGDSAFYGCSTIRSFTVKEGNASFAAFDDCLYNKDLTTLYLVPQVKEEIVFSPNVRTIAAGAFYKSNVRAVTVPATVRTIEAGAFTGVRKLEELTVPFIGGSADDTDTDYMIYIFGGTVQKGDSIQADGTYEYQIGNTSCTPASLKKLTVSAPITYIPEFAFAYLTEVTEIVLNGSVTEIDDYAFCRTGLEELIVPNTVKRIGDYAFAGMDDLEKAVIPGSVGGNLGVSLFMSCSALETVVFEEGVTKIPAFAFQPSGSTDPETGEMNYYSNLKSVTLPATIEQIGENAFAYAGTRYIGEIGSTYSNLVFILPADSNLKTIDKAAFFRSSIQSIALPACFEEVGEMAFFGCAALSTVTFGNATEGSALIKLGGASFAGCKGLAEMKIYKDVRTEADLPVIEIYTVSTTSENVSFNLFAGGATPSIYVRSAALYRNAAHWDEYDVRIFELK